MGNGLGDIVVLAALKQRVIEQGSLTWEDELGSSFAKLHPRPLQGVCTVLGHDRYDHQTFFYGLYRSPVHALRVAREQTREAAPLASHACVATVYRAYGPDGLELTDSSPAYRFQKDLDDAGDAGSAGWNSAGSVSSSGWTAF
jgi:hypothetical protein